MNGTLVRRIGYLALALSLILCGCAAPGASHWHRIGQAAVQAATEPATWGPLIPAALLAASGADQRLSNWAVEHTPVYGSTTRAENSSDSLVDASRIGFLASALAASDGTVPETWIRRKAWRIIAGQATVLVTKRVTYGLKNATGRERPNRSDTLSFPSGHTSEAATYDRLSIANLDTTGLTPTTRQAGDWLFYGLTYATGWARVEAGNHYPSDILAGAALGNFFGAFAAKAFLPPGSHSKLSLVVEPRSVHLGLQLKY